MKGVIFINPFLVPEQSVHQAERLKTEFNNLGVDIDIISDGFSRVQVDGKETLIDICAPDFAIYLDKDKYLSEILEKSGLRLFNRHDAVRVCDDKGQTYIALTGKGVKFPKTIFGALCYKNDGEIKDEWVNSIFQNLGFPIIVKESFGSMGKGVHLANDKAELLKIMNQVKLKPHLFQEYIPFKKGVDVRVIVIGGKAVACMERRNDNDYRSNVGQGGQGVKIELPESFKAVAENCAEILGLDYCGVDLLYGKDGEPIVCEVNSNAFFDGIESVSGVNVAKKYAEYIIKTIYN
ncbi:MAG: RimK family alpha-L-glutamate ligase [Clostridia bacterium]|nr:RimK family alpha-L-glutamate ligase [Clostridia bacterium]